MKALRSEIMSLGVIPEAAKWLSGIHKHQSLRVRTPLPQPTGRGYGFRSQRSAPSRNDNMPAIKPDRVLGDLYKLRSFGTYKTGVHRPTFSPQDIEARNWFAEQCTAAGLDTSIDGIGNIFAKSSATGAKVLSGSHLESQNHA